MHSLHQSLLAYDCETTLKWEEKTTIFASLPIPACHLLSPNAQVRSSLQQLKHCVYSLKQGTCANLAPPICFGCWMCC